MAYINTSHSVGNIVFFYDAASDSVRRLRVLAIVAKATESGYAPDWEVRYHAVTANATGTGIEASVLTYSDGELHSRPEYAFPEIVHVAEPLAELEAA